MKSSFSSELKKVLYIYNLGTLRLYWETPFWNESSYVQSIYDLVLDIADHFLYATNQDSS